MSTNFFDSRDPRQDEIDRINSDINLQNRALEDIISNQQKEESQIKDDFNSLGSRAGRFLGVLGAGLRGENASAVAQSYNDRLDKQLQYAQSRFKDQRDSAYNRYKDTLARREALNKDLYQKERDKVQDERWDKTFDYNKLRDDVRDSQWDKTFNYTKDRDLVKDNQWDKTFEYNKGRDLVKDDQFNRTLENNKEQFDKTYGLSKDRFDYEKTKDTLQKAQALKEIDDNEQKQFKNDFDTSWKIEKAIENGLFKDTGYAFGVGVDKTKKATVDNINLDLAKKNYGVEPKDARKFIKDNPDLFLDPADDEDTILMKLQETGYYNPIQSISEPNENDQQLVTYVDGSKYLFDNKTERYTKLED